MKALTLTPEQKAQTVYRIKQYFQRELDEEIGQFDAEFLLDFFAKEIGPWFYNQGLHDAHGVIESHLEGAKETLFSMEELI